MIISDKTLDKYMVHTSYQDNAKEFVLSIPNMTDIEGFVIEYEPQRFVKVKTSEYLKLHGAFDQENAGHQY